MKNLTNMTIAAAALMVTAGMAKAQVIKAEVPFSFRANGTVMPAGEYRVERLGSHGGTTILKVRNVDANRAILAVPYVSNSGAPEDASLTFQCSGDQCSLVQVNTGAGQAYGLPAPKLSRDGDTHMSVIRAVLASR